MFNDSFAILIGASYSRFETLLTSHSRSTPQFMFVAPKPTRFTTTLQLPASTRRHAVAKMTPTPAAICKRRPHLHLSASILFTPKELRQYLRFRRSTILHLSDSEMNRIPIASEYADFLAWKEKQRTRESHHDLFNPCRSFGDLSAHISSVNETSSASNDGALSLSFAVAKRCGHILHPGTPYPHASATKQLHVERCPVCTVDMHVTYMALLFKALNANGGPFRPRDAPDSQHEAVFQAWNAGKLNLVQTIYHYEKYAKHEEDFRRCMYTNLTAWESNSAEEYLQRTYSAKAALNIYHEQVLELKPDFEAEITQQNIEKSSRKCGKRRVNFREGTCFDPSRCHAYFYRKSPRFDGKYLRQRIHEDKATESESDIETPTIIGGNTESNCSDIEGSILGRCLDSDASQESESAICRDVQHDTMSSALNISFESSTSSSDTTVRGSSEDPDSASESDTDVEGMDVEDRVESILFGCASADDDPRDEEDGTEENEDSSDEDSSGSEGEWDEEDDDFGGDFIIFG
jgi:hypothetical protein